MFINVILKFNAMGIFSWFWESISGFFSGSRYKEEREELSIEGKLRRDSIKEIKTQQQEKATISKLIRYFESLLRDYLNLLSMNQSTTFRNTERGEASLSSKQIEKILRGLISQLEKMKREKIPLKTEETMFSNFVRYWGIVYREMFKTQYLPNLKDPNSNTNFQRAYENIKKFSEDINALLKELGAELKLEEKLDEDKKREITMLFNAVEREEGTGARPGSFQSQGARA